MKKKYFVGFLIIILGFILWSFWPLKSLIFQKNWFTGTTLLLITNENEARPCGGFVTVFGELKPGMLPDFSLKNSYHYSEVSGYDIPSPLSSIAPSIKFWDLAMEADMQKCTQNFYKFYDDHLPTKKISQVLFFPTDFLSDLLQVSGPVFFESSSLGRNKEGIFLTEKNVFAVLSRLSADTDRHDEETLATRKKPLADFSKKILKISVLKFWNWRELAELVNRKIQTGEIYVENISPRIYPKNSDLSVIEWNTGGGKASRYLEKNLQISLREDAPSQWKAYLKISAQHTGPVWDEPLSQDYSGALELRLPENFTEKENIITPIRLKPGEVFTKEWQFDIWQEDLSDFSVFIPRNQTINLQFSVTHYPQKDLHTISKNLKSREGSARFLGKINMGQTKFEWSVLPDISSPFITMHEGFLSHTESLPDNHKQIFKTEIHFNEPVQLGTNFSAKLLDRDYSIAAMTENLTGTSYDFLPDGHTLVVDFPFDTWQPEERFFLELNDVSDLHGHVISGGNRTVIMR